MNGNCRLEAWAERSGSVASVAVKLI